MLQPVSDEEIQNILNVKKMDSQIYKNEEVNPVSLVEVTSLPSNFKGYPEGTKIQYKPLTLGEIKSLNTSSEEDLTRGIAMLLNSIHCNTIKPEQLYYWDVMYVGIQRKLLAFGDTRGVIYNQCPECGGIVEKEFDYTELEFKELEAPDLPIFTNIAGKEFEFGLLTIKDFLEINIEEGELGVYARMTKNLPFEEAYDILSNCYGKDADKVRYIDEKLNYGIKPFIVTCNNQINVDGKKQKCKNKVRMEVRSPFEVVFPESKNKRSFDAEIQYGRK